MRELETSLQQFGEFLLKARLVKEQAAPYCVRWVRRFRARLRTSRCRTRRAGSLKTSSASAPARTGRSVRPSRLGSRNSGWALRGSRSTDSGVTWSAAADLAVTAEGSDHPQLVARDDTVLVCWLTARDGYLLQAIR
jgi:hypothetical protein